VNSSDEDGDGDVDPSLSLAGKSRLNARVHAKLEGVCEAGRCDAHIEKYTHVQAFNDE
jgi:hypothetical protein